jgi:hypothetical protein
MGTKIILYNKFIIIFLTLSMSNLMIAQNHSRYDYARLYSLKRCLDINYFALDSLFLKRIPDVTSSLVLQSLSPEEMNEIDKLVAKKAANFYKEHPYGSYDNKNANQIVYFCWELYESREFKKELKKIIKNKR